MVFFMTKVRGNKRSRKRRTRNESKIQEKSCSNEKKETYFARCVRYLFFLAAEASDTG